MHEPQSVTGSPNETHSSDRRNVLRLTAGLATGGLLTSALAGTASADDGQTVEAVIVKGDERGIPEVPEKPQDGLGELFDTTSFKVTGKGEVIHHELPFASGKPYVLKHQGQGRYRPNGAVMNVDGDPTDTFLPDSGRWRVVVREDVQAAPTGSFGWSVTRVDVYARRGMKYAYSLLIAVWDRAIGYPPEAVIGNYRAMTPANPGGR